MLKRPELIWITPDADNLIAHIARVSNPKNQNNTETAGRLIRYLIDHNHWSPFETVSACVEFNTTRDIGRQILRHRSFTFQEFSGRYAAYEELIKTRECRLQDAKNRQNSLATDDDKVVAWWEGVVRTHAEIAEADYREALSLGIAKEVARSILPEGLVPTRMYMTGTIRSWIHYCKERCAPGVQKEHRLLAEHVRQLLGEAMPNLNEALKNYW